MSNIFDEKTYNQRIDEFKKIINSDTVILEEKISTCEEIVYSDYCKENNRFECINDLLDLYNKAGRYNDIVNFIMFEFKSRFKDDEFYDAETNWFIMIAALDPSLGFRVVDAEISMGDYEKAKGMLLGLKENRLDMLNKHQSDGLRDSCVFWYSHVLAKYAQIAIIEGDAAGACEYLNDKFWKDYDAVSVESTYYMAQVWSGKIDSYYKDAFSLQLFEKLAELDINSDKWNDEDREMIIDSNYQLGLLYATDSNWEDKNKAKRYLDRAKSLGLSITEDELQKLIQSKPSKVTNQNNRAENETQYNGSQNENESSFKSGFSFRSILIILSFVYLILFIIGAVIKADGFAITIVVLGLINLFILGKTS